MLDCSQSYSIFPVVLLMIHSGCTKLTVILRFDSAEPAFCSYDPIQDSFLCIVTWRFVTKRMSRVWQVATTPRKYLNPCIQEGREINQRLKVNYFSWFSMVFTGNSSFYCVKRVRIRSYSGLHFPAFGLNTERMRTRITPNTDTFHVVFSLFESSSFGKDIFCMIVALHSTSYFQINCRLTW